MKALIPIGQTDTYNGNELASENKDKIAKNMTPAAISKAQDMSSRCLESNYTDC